MTPLCFFNCALSLDCSRNQIFGDRVSSRVCHYLLVGVIECSLKTSIFLLQLLHVGLQPAQILFLLFSNTIQPPDVLPVLFLHLLLPIEYLDAPKSSL